MKGLRIRLLAIAMPAIISTGCFLTEPDNLPPVVTITQPSARSEYALGEIVEIVAEAADSDGVVSSVIFYLDGVRIREDHVSPYTLIWNTMGTASVEHRIRAVAIDEQDAQSDDEVSVDVNWVYAQPDLTDDGWETASLASVGMDEVLMTRLVNDLRDDDSHLLHGIAIAVGGRLVYEVYFDGLSHPTFGQQPKVYHRDALHALSSVTKSVTSTLLGIAIDRGFIDSADERALDYFPDLVDLDMPPRSEISLRHLVTMSSGLEWDEYSYGLDDIRNDIIQFNRLVVNTDVDPVRWVLEKDVVADPGIIFNYSGGNTNILGLVIQEAGGMRLDEFADEYLFGPLGIDNAAWILFRPDFVYASGDISLTPRDMLKLGQLYLQNGIWEGERILSSEWVEASSTAAHSFSETYRGHGMVGYGHGWWIKSADYGNRVYSAWGWGGQDIIVFPDRAMVVAITSGGYWSEPAMWAHDIVLRYVLPSMP